MTTRGDAAWSRFSRRRASVARASVWRWFTAWCAATRRILRSKAPWARARPSTAAEFSRCRTTPAAAEPPNPRRSSRFRARQRILVVDDDPLLIEITCATSWRRSGYCVVMVANGGQEGIGAFRAGKGTATSLLPLVITDLGMPYRGWPEGRGGSERDVARDTGNSCWRQWASGCID